MLKYSLNELCWQNEENIKKVTECLNDTTNKLKTLTKRRLNNDFYDIYNMEEKTQEIFNCEIPELLTYWTRNTYVGVKKDLKLVKSYNRLFDAIYNYLMEAKRGNFKNTLVCEKDFAERILYQGKIYRYLAFDEEGESVEYDDTWSSWSKEKGNPYLISKMNKKYTVLLTGFCDNNDYGIDLEAWGLSCGDEREVVFPTRKSNITNIEYLD